MTHFDRLQAVIHRLEQAYVHASQEDKKTIDREIYKMKAEIGKILRLRSGKEPKSFEPGGKRPIPCYFNAGCCGYTNGTTCIEIDSNVMRLIKWQRQDKKRRILEEKDIHTLLQYIKEARPIDNIFQPGLSGENQSP